MIKPSLQKAFEYQKALARAIYESSALYFGHTLLSERNGDLPAKTLFVTDVPETRGGAESGTPFWDPTVDAQVKNGKVPSSATWHSPTSRRFWELAKPLKLKAPLPPKGFSGSRAYVAYLLPRHPSTPHRGHRSPTPTELRIALQLLAAQTRLAQPRVLVSLGSAALKAVTKLLKPPKPLQVGKPLAMQADWGPVTIVPLAHPRPSERLARPDWQQKSDWKKLARIVKKTR